MQTEIAARIDQPVHNQQFQHLGPAHVVASPRQFPLPEPIQSQLQPQLAAQPAVAVRPGAPQLHFAQLDIDRIHGTGGRRSIFRKQAILRRQEQKRCCSATAVSIPATGMNWLVKFPTVRPFVRIGTQYVPIESITPDTQDAGVCTLTVTLPSDISGGPVPVVIEVVQSDGRSVASNPASIPIETRQRPASRPFIVQ